MLPDLESLRCFEAAATHLNFRVAAKTVALSPAAFGDRIKRLEDQLAAPLFVRTTRRVALTAAGHDRGPIPYELTVGTRFELGLSRITPALQPLAALRPERTLHLVFGDSDDLVARVRNGLLDCAVTSARLTVAGLSYEVLHEEDYVFVGSAALLARTPLSRAAHATAHVLLDTAADLPLFRYFLDARGRGEAWTFGRIEYLGTIGAIRLRMLQRAGVAVLPRYFVAGDLASGKLVEILPRVRLQRDAFRLVWRSGHAHEQALRLLAADLAKRPLR